MCRLRSDPVSFQFFIQSASAYAQSIGCFFLVPAAPLHRLPQEILLIFINCRGSLAPVIRCRRPKDFREAGRLDPRAFGEHYRMFYCIFEFPHVSWP